MKYDIADFLDGCVVSEPETVAMINRELTQAEQIVNETGVNLFLTGKAGTGKTTFLRRLRETSNKRMIVLAPTGVAAINAEGVTIHSFFQLGFSVYIPGRGYADDSTRRYTLSRLKRRIIMTLDLLVIDEISMVRPDTLDAIDELLRRTRGVDAPFGGVQLLLIGDLRQLSPVVKPEDWALMQPYYQSPYFFDSRALKQAGFLTIELKTVYRQTDTMFVELLGAVRDGRADARVLEAINSRHIPGFVPPPGDGYIYLTTHNYIAQSYNLSRLQGLPTPEVTFDSSVEGEFPESAYPADEHLVLKVGAQVMFIKNDQGSDRKFYNGMIGTVTNIGTETITVQPVSGGNPVEVGRLVWENTRYSINETNGEIRQEVTGTFTQFPLRLAWAITIHKSQGLTFDRAIIDAAYSFAPGQTYVALSRCRTLDGLVLTAPLTASSMIIDRQVNDFMAASTANTPDESRINAMKESYARSMFAEMIDFKGIRASFAQFQRAMAEYVVPIHDEVGPRLAIEDARMVERVGQVADKFLSMYAGVQLGENFIADSTRERIRSGCRYFADELWQTLHFLKSLAGIDIANTTYVTRLNNALEELRYRLMLKYEILRSMSDRDFSTSNYNRVKTAATLRADESPTGIRIEKKRAAKAPKPDKAPQTEKKPVGYTRTITLNLYKEGKDIPAIALERQLAPTTIAQHIAYFVNRGELCLDRLIPTAHMRQLQHTFAQNRSYKDAREELGDSLEAYEITLYYHAVVKPVDK